MNKSIRCWSLGLMMILIISWFSWQEIKAQGANWMPVKYVRIEGAFQYIAKEKIKQVVIRHVMNGLYNIDVRQVRQSVKQLAWVEQVKVQRIWPDAVKISIKEQSPVVRWGAKKLLNKRGQAFKPVNINMFNQLPLLDGPVGSEKVLLTKMNEMSAALIKQGMKLMEFHVNERRAWKLILDNKMELKLGTNEPEKKFNRFLKTFALLGTAQIKKVAGVDLRYANGYALTLKEHEEKIDWKHVAQMN